MTTPSETALSAEDIANVLEVLESQERLGHTMTLMPTDVLRRLLDAARSQPATEDGRAAVDEALWDQWTAGERLAYGVGYRRGLAATEPAGDERT